MADLSKITGYVIEGGSTTKVSAAKLTAYAVTGIASNSVEIASKLVAYAVVMPSSGVVARPQVFVCT